MSKKLIKIRIPIYETWLYIGIGSIEKFFNKLNWEPTTPLDTCNALAASMPDELAVYVFFRRYCKKQHGIIAHEAKHVVNMVFQEKGIKLDTENDEPECYLLSWVVSEIYKAFSEKK